MRVPLSWLREFAQIPPGATGREVAERLIAAGLEVETVETIGDGASGPLLVGQVLAIEDLTEFKKPIRFCRVDVGPMHGHADTPGERGIICGARNFAQGDLVVVALPGAILPGGFDIASRKTYGRLSDGMICSESELGLGSDHDGIIVLPPLTAEPGTAIATQLGVGDEVLDIAVTPDRGYALSIRGVAREAAAAYGVDFYDPGTDLANLPEPQGTPAPCDSEDPAGCDLFTLATVVGFDPAAPTPLWLRSRLTACGMRPVSLAVDVTNYVMLEMGQPLHAFDLDTLVGSVRARRAIPGEALETLDHVVRALDSDDLVIADDTGALGLAGTMGGVTSEIGPATRNIALEAAHFDPNAVARMSRRHKLSSEASRRFERGVDPELPVYASARAVSLLLQLGGGTYVGREQAASPLAPVAVQIPNDLAARVAGMPISPEVAIQHLRAVGCTVDHQGSTLAVEPPSWRPDLTDPNDFTEEIIRLVGYDEVPSVLPEAPAGRGWTPAQRLRKRVGVLLAGAGFVETLSYPFIGGSDLDALQVPELDQRRRLVRLANPLSEEQPFLRTTLLPGLLTAAQRNLSRGITDLALYDSGSVFFAHGRPSSSVRPSVEHRPGVEELEGLDALLPDQPHHLAVLVCGEWSPAGWWGPSRPASWADAIGALRRTADELGADLRISPGVDGSLHPGRCAQFALGPDVVGFGGELHPRVIAALGLPPRTAVAEVNLSDLLGAAGSVTAPVVATMPLAKEDVALVVGRDVSASAVADALQNGAGPLLESLRLFDEYTGTQLGEGEKSLAFSLRFRALNRTLKANEVAAARDAAVDRARMDCGAQLRG